MTQLVKYKLIWVLLIAALKETCYWIWPEEMLLNTILKLAAGVAVFMICYGWNCFPGKDRGGSHAEGTDWLTIAAVILFIIADMVIRWQFLVSGALFFLGHLLLVICFWIKRRPSMKSLIVWAVLTVVEAPLLIWLLTSNEFSFPVGCLGAVYGSMLIMMVVSAFRQECLAMAGAVLFVLSDLFLALHKAFDSLQWMHAPSILLFYLSIGLFLLNINKSIREEGKG